jgi:predicted negative regulator of RcsB-dependent stress response
VLAQHLTARSERVEALALLEGIPPGDPLFEAMRMRRMGRLMIALGRYDEARSLFWRSLNDDDRPKSRDRVDDWIDRCEWMKAHDG